MLHENIPLFVDCYGMQAIHRANNLLHKSLSQTNSICYFQNGEISNTVHVDPRSVYQCTKWCILKQNVFEHDLLLIIKRVIVPCNATEWDNKSKIEGVTIILGMFRMVIYVN